MTLLPIVGRELRVAARKRSTFWLRIAAALTALAIAGAVMIIFRLIGTFPASVGTILFQALTWLSFGAVLSAGLFFTSDCLSEEKREGTLGFLFLTDLRGYDVVAGKLFATSLRCFYALLAVFPILGVTLLIGGVTGAQFSKTLLALVNALFCSLAAGMFVSALSRDPQKAMAATLFLVLSLAWGGSLADSLHDKIAGRASGPFFALFSPLYVFRQAGSWSSSPGTDPYWTGLLWNQALSWVLLGVASVLVPRTWQERGRRSKIAQGDWSYFWKYGSAGHRAALRRKLLDKNPVLWLALRERWQGLVIWGIAILTASQFIFISTSRQPLTLVAWSGMHRLVMLLAYLWLPSQASRFFVDGRRGGFIELLLVSPMDSETIVRAQWPALVRLYGLPLIVILGAQLVATCVQEYPSLAGRARMASSARVRTYGSTNGTVATSFSYGTAPGTNGTTTGTNSFAFATTAIATGQQVAVMITTAIMSAVTTLANLIALCWFGMWMGMTSKNNNLATLKTIVFVQIIPLLISYFLSALVMMAVLMPWAFSRMGRKNPGAGLGASSMIFIPLIYIGSMAVLSIAKDIGFALWARKKLRASFREQAAKGAGPVRFEAPPRLPPQIPPAIPPLAMAQP